MCLIYLIYAWDESANVKRLQKLGLWQRFSLSTDSALPRGTVKMLPLTLVSPSCGVVSLSVDASQIQPSRVPLFHRPLIEKLVALEFSCGAMKFLRFVRLRNDNMIIFIDLTCEVLVVFVDIGE